MKQNVCGFFAHYGQQFMGKEKKIKDLSNMHTHTHMMCIFRSLCLSHYASVCLETIFLFYFFAEFQMQKKKKNQLNFLSLSLCYVLRMENRFLVILQKKKTNRNNERSNKLWSLMYKNDSTRNVKKKKRILKTKK